MKPLMKRWLILFCLLLLIVPVFAQSTDDDEDANRDFPPQYATDQIIAVVVYPRVNLRTAPNLDSVVVDIAILGDKYPIVGEDDTGEFYLVESGGGVVWIHANSVLATYPDEIGRIGENLTLEQQASIDAQVAYAQVTVGVRGALNIRRGPGSRYPIIGRVPSDGRVFLQGRNLYGTWILVNYNGVVGWVSYQYIYFPIGFRLDFLPVVG